MTVTAHDPDAMLLTRLRGGDEEAFVTLVDCYATTMMRVARMYVSSHAVAEEVVQETWLGVLRGLGGFEGRSSLRTWVFRILVNRARTRGEREHRTVPFAAVDADRFLPSDHDRCPHHWALPSERWEESPQRHLDTLELRALVRDTVAGLPPAQRLVITMRDLEGWDAADTAAALDVSEGNQRVLLHRARSRVRRELAEALDG